LVIPAPGQPGKMPFWRGENAARPLEFGQRIGALARKLQGMSANNAHSLLAQSCGLNQNAADNLLRYLQEQAEVSTVPDDKTIVIECARDELGDWRIALLSPLGGQVLAPWSIAMIGLAKELRSVDIEASWANDGIVVRAPEAMELGDLSWLFPDEETLETTLYAQLAKTSTFAARFREAAARALILTKRRPGMRTPLWQQRKKSTDLFASASRFPSFPILLEAYRELIGDIFDVAALKTVLRDIRSGAVKVKIVESNAPSPFAASLLFGYAGQFLYDGDTPPSERKAQALAIDLTQLKDLLGALDLRDLLDIDSIGQVEQQLQCVADDYRAKDEESLYDVLLKLGDLSVEEIRLRAADPDAAVGWSQQLIAQRRAVWIRMANQERLIAVEYAGRYMGALGLPPPRGLVLAQVSSSEDPLSDVIMRFARTHVPFVAASLTQRYGAAGWGEKIAALVAAGKLLKGAFTPGRQDLEFTTPDVLSRIQRKAVLKLRTAVEPAPKEHYARALTHLQGLVNPRRGMDAILDVVEQLQGMPIIASLLESEVLPARVNDYLSGDIDTLITSGEVVWVGVAAAGASDGYVALYLADHLATLRVPVVDTVPISDVEQRIIDVLKARGALFSTAIADALRPIFTPELTAAIWSLVFRGYLTNDSLFPLRNLVSAGAKSKSQRARPGAARSNRLFRSRRAAPSNAEGRWSLLPGAALENPTVHLHAKAESLLARYGLVTREVAELEQIPGGFSALYNVYRTMEERGRLQRGYFVADIPAMQFAHGSSVELIRSMKKMPAAPEQLWLSAVDPANPYGALLPWPVKSAVIKPSRSVGAHVALANGQLLGWLSKSGKSLFTFFPDDDAAKHRLVGCLGALLANYAIAKMASREGLLVEEIDGQLPAHHPLFRGLLSAGFELAGGGLRLRVERPTFGQKHLPAPNTTMLEQQESTAPQSIENEIAREMDEAGLS
jgi:ATP-dependent helicase Lhr and Lhr-like helicase